MLRKATQSVKLKWKMADKAKKQIPKDLLARLDWAEKTLRSILKGEKPHINPKNKVQGWLYKQMLRMHKDFFIPEVPKSYVTLPGEKKAEIERKGITEEHPLSYAQTKRKMNIDQYMHKNDIRNYKVLGTDYGFRDVERDPLEQSDYADAFILGRGDFFALWQFVNILKAKITKTDDYPSLANKTLVVQNSGGRFWDSMIKGLKLEKYTDVLQITTFPNETKKILAKDLGEWADREPKKSRATPHIKPGSVFLLATGNSKKVFELQDIMNTQKTGVRVVPFNTVFPKPEEAKELSQTYIGNNVEKAEKTWERLAELPKEEIERLLKIKGYDPEKTYIWFDDRGLETAEDFMSDGIFNECRSYLNPYKPGPGAELAHVLKSMSIEDFYARTKRIVDNMGRPADLTVKDIMTYMVAPVMPDEKGHRAVYSFSAATEDTLTFSPRPANDLHKYSEHYQTPKNIPDDRTKAEIEGYIENMSAMALAARAAIHTFDMEKNRSKAPGLQAQFRQGSKSRSWKIGTQYSVRSGKSGQVSKGLARRLNGNFSFMRENNGDYNVITPSIHELKQESGDNETVSSSLNNFFRLAVDTDCFVLTPESRKTDIKKYFWQRMFVFYSLVVGKQIFDPVISSKALAILNKDGDNTWKPALDLYTHLHAKSLVGDKPHHVFRTFDTVEKTSDYVQRRMKNYIPDNVPNPAYQEQGGQTPEDLFKVTVFCSATSTNGILRDNARKLGFQLAAYGFALKNGGGSGGVQENFEKLFNKDGFVRGDVRREGLMVETSLGVHEFRHWWKNNFDEEPPETWVESIQCEQTFQSEGLCEFNDRSVVHPNIFHRMDDLAKTDAFIIDAGGAGTVQEIAAALMLREAGELPVHNVPFIIINTETGRGAHKNTIWGPLIDMMTPKMMRELNIHIVDNHSDAVKICREARAAKNMEPDNLPNYEEILRDMHSADPVQAIQEIFRPGLK